MCPSTIKNFGEQLGAPNSSLRIKGYYPSACARLLTQGAALAASSNSKNIYLVICPDFETVEELKNDLEAFGAKVEVLPTWELSPYAGFSPSIQVRHSRVRTLAAVALNRPTSKPLFILSTLGAVSQTTAPIRDFQNRIIYLNKSSEIESREALAEKLGLAGYLRVDTVEDPGTYSIRGEIVDIFSPDQRRPYRIELFDTNVEKIRFFFTETQRTLPEELDGATIVPAREVLFSSENLTKLKEQIKDHCDNLGVRKNIRDAILDQIENQHAGEWLDCYAPFAYEKNLSFFDNASDQINGVIWIDEFKSDQNAETEKSKLVEAFDSIESLTRILPSPEKLFNFNQKNELCGSKIQKIYFDRIQIDLANQKDVKHFDFEIQPTRELVRAHKTSIDLISKLIKDNVKVFVFSNAREQSARIKNSLESQQIKTKSANGFSFSDVDHSHVHIVSHSISAGYYSKLQHEIFFTADEFFNSAIKTRKSGDFEDLDSIAVDATEGERLLNDLFEGDSVVHKDHGVGLYRGIVRLKTQEVDQDFIQIEYANQDKLYLPVYRLNLLQKYISDGEHVTLDRLGSKDFEKAKEKAKESAKKIAFDLVALYAKRQLQKGIVFGPRDRELTEFEEKFPYQETRDQLSAIRATYKDLQSGKIMDRLVCGDVGFGKTEVAIRAAFKVISEGKQVAVLVPTTLLCHQHEETFKSRYKGYPFIVESLSRFKSHKKQKEIIQSLKEGKVDVVIGTHRLLSKDIEFHDLGLIIVDEEHRFGVEQKERLKTLRTNTHVLSLSATPIPRTLSMALSGLREISIINTPPVNRLPIRTSISRFEDGLIRSAIQQELARGGQVFFLHNRVQTIHRIEARLKKIIPEARIITAHGQMTETELEKKMVAFYNHEADVLLCTTIIESGIDIPNANTIIIDRADRLGLSQLYQIRGRVGRSDRRAFAYLLIPEEGAITDDSQKRLEIIQRFVELGSGFHIASHDLELRGGGDFLGASQSGHILAVGFELYTELLNEAILEIRGKSDETQTKSKEPEIKTPYPSYLSEEYIPDPHHRISLYRRLSAAKDEKSLYYIEDELKDRFGPLPKEAENLFWIIRIKQILSRLNFDALTVGTERLTLSTQQESAIDPARVISLVASNNERYQFSGDSRLIVKVSTHSAEELFHEIEKLTKLMVT